MHHSSTIQSPSDQPFLSEFKNNKKRKEKQQQAKDTVIDMLDIETDDTRKSFQRCLDPNNKDVSFDLIYDFMLHYNYHLLFSRPQHTKTA